MFRRVDARVRVRREHRREAQSGVVDGTGHIGVACDAAHRSRQRGEATGRELDAHGRGDDVLQLVRLVEHHHLVRRQEMAAARQMHGVEVSVDDDDVGLGGPLVRRLRQTELTLRAS